MRNVILEKFKKGIPSIGTITHLQSASVVESMGVTGLDFIFLDMEHCPVGIHEINTYLSAADAAQITPIVRVGERSRSAVLRVLDAGAKGVVVPCIETVEQVRELVQYAKFKPIGDRGYCMTRDGKWGFDAIYTDGMNGYMQTCNRETMLIPQCETVGCLEHIEEITAMDGVDGILIGPYDLSIGMGLDGQFDHPDFQRALERILQACKTNGNLAMVFVGNENDIADKLKDGFDSILYGIDILSVIAHYRGVVEKFHTITER